MAMIAVWTMYVAVIMAVGVIVVMIAVRAVNVFLLSHASYSWM